MEKEKGINKMGVMSIKKLLITMGVPMMVSMALQAVYNIVDAIFVSQMKDTPAIKNMGDYASNALTLAFPIQMLMVAVGVGTGVGINALLSRYIGAGQKDKAGKIAGNSIFLGICTYIIFLVFSILGINVYVSSQTSDPIIIEMTTSYLKICTTLSFGITMYLVFEKLLQATGRTIQTTIAQITGACVNIILDPIMIFGYFGMPSMGIEGAAYATVIGQCVTCLIDMVFHFKYNNRDFETKISYIKPDVKIIKEIYKIGIPAIIMQALMSFTTYGVNIIFGQVSTSAVTAYGIYYKIQQFVFFAAFGMNNAMIPVIAFNYGMKNKKRIKQGIKYGILYTVAIMAVGLIILQIFAVPIIGIFALSDETRKLCVLAIRIITLGYLFVGANIAYQGIYQALGHGISSLVLSLLRLVVISLPLAWVFTKIPYVESMIWMAFPIGEIISFVVGIFIMKSISKKDIDTINEQIYEEGVSLIEEAN